MEQTIEQKKLNIYNSILKCTVTYRTETEECRIKTGADGHGSFEETGEMLKINIYIYLKNPVLNYFRYEQLNRYVHAKQFMKKSYFEKFWNSAHLEEEREDFDIH